MSLSTTRPRGAQSAWNEFSQSGSKLVDAPHATSDKRAVGSSTFLGNEMGANKTPNKTPNRGLCTHSICLAHSLYARSGFLPFATSNLPLVIRTTVITRSTIVVHAAMYSGAYECTP
eukprot:30063-Pleurochrysis_carterae.AAC.1